MSNIVSFKASLPSTANLKSFAASLRTSVQSAVQSTETILKMDKTGAWVYGKDQIEIQEGSKWAINPFSFVHGFIAWGDGEVLGERMAAMQDPLPEVGQVPAGARSWDLQLGISLKCISGDDKDMECVFRTTSHGGKNALKELGTKIAAQADSFADDPNPAVVPIVTLDSDSYRHKQYGTIYTPKIDIKEWVTLAGPAATAPAVAAPAAVTEAPAVEEPARRRRRAAVPE
jgi:hypothetical protein